MKKNLLPFILLILISAPAFSQKVITPISNEDYDALKRSGNLDPAVKYMLIPSKPQGNSPQGLTSKTITYPKPDSTGTGACSCIVPLDATFSVAAFTNGIAPDYRNDDGSTNSISLPFTFCMYGTNYSSIFINNNGNVSFVSASSVFSSTGFPNSTDVMIAPFWADVDTRNASSGLVHYKVTPTYMIVKWEGVGYYSQHVDKLCTFQLIITDGSDPILPSGKNIAFCYGDMNWTTGDASQGQNGFNVVSPPAGTSSTVGVNKGNGTNFIQIGRFGFPGAAYFGPYALNSQVDYLDFKSYYFDVCGTSTNLPPISTTNSACGDTLTICGLSDTLVLNSIFIAPENNQNVTISASAPTLGSNFVIINNTSGVTGQIDFMVIGSTSLAGYHTITITATDNGTPALSTTVTYVIHIVNNPIPDPVISISPQPACAASNPTLTLTNCSSYNSTVWSNGSTGCSISTNVPGQYFVTVSDSGCYKTSFTNAIILPNPNPTILGPLNYCNASGTTLTVVPDTGDAAPYTNIVWNPGAVNNDTLFNALANTYTVTVTDTNGCTGSSTATVTSNPPTVTITANPPNLCPGDSTTLTASISGATSYSWSPGGATTQSITASVPGVYSVTVTANGCVAQNSFNLVTASNPTVTISGTTSFCAGSNTTLSAFGSPIGTYSFSWSTGSTGTSVIVATSGTATLIGTNASTGCKDTAAVNITVNPNPVAALSATNNNVICSGSTGTISANVTGGSSPYTYAWTPNVGLTQNVTVSNIGTYTVTVTDQNNCKDTAQITITASNPNVSLNTTDSTICPGQCDTLIAVGSNAAGITYTWPANFASVNDSVMNCQPGTYKVYVTDASGCRDSASVTITQNAVPTADFSFTPLPPQQPNVVVNFMDLSVGTISLWGWNFGDGTGSNLQNPNHSYSTGGTFPVTLAVVASNGCIDTVTKFYTIDAQVYAPNIITPNGDGKNDALYFKGLEFYPNNRIVIFNRWGQKIYEKDGYGNDWNGAGYNDGTYYYILEAPNAKPQSTFTSYFTIIR